MESSEQYFWTPNPFSYVPFPSHADICANNCTYVNAIGTVGNWHIVIYTWFLFMCLVDPIARPRTKQMKCWIDMTRFTKIKAPGGAFDFFTYSDLVYWFCFTIVVNPFRWKWAAFVLCGIGKEVPLGVVEKEDRARNGMGMQNSLANHGGEA